MKFEEFYPHVEGVVQQIADSFGRTSRRYGADEEDFKQELIAWLLDNETRLSARFTRDQDEAAKYVSRCLFNEAKDHSADLRKQSGVVAVSEQEKLSTRKLTKRALPLMFHREDGCTNDHLLDLAAAFERLAQEDRDLLAQYHRDGWMNKMVAEAQGLSEQGASYRHNAAIDRLVALLGEGGPEETSPGWRGRRSVTSATARAYQSHLYDDGEYQ